MEVVGYLLVIISILAFVVAMYYQLRISFRLIVIRQDVSLLKRGSLFLSGLLKDDKLNNYFKWFLRSFIIFLVSMILGVFLTC